MVSFSKTINTRDFTIQGVKDEMIDNGWQIDADITEIHDPSWIEHRPAGDVSHVIYVHQIPEIIAFHAMTPELWDHTLALMGPTAVGKTEGVRAGLNLAADRMGRTLHMHELHVSQMGPVDALGVPRERDNQTYWAPPEIWPLAKTLEMNQGHQTKVNDFLGNYRATGKLEYELLPKDWFVHFHDEVTNPSSPQVPHQLFPAWCGDSDGRMIGGHRLVRDYFVVLAGNRVQDGTNSINLANSAVTRLGLIEILPHYGGWLQNYAFKTRVFQGQEVTKIHPIVIAYLNKFNARFAPQDSNDRSPMDPFPTPRNWKYVSDIFYANDNRPLREDLLRPAIAGRIGNATAQELFTFISHYKDLPDVDKLLRGEKVQMPDPNKRPDLTLILGTHMVMKLGPQNAKVFMAYMRDPKSFPGEISAATMKQLRPANKLGPLVREWAKEEFREWTKQYEAYVF